MASPKEFFVGNFPFAVENRLATTDSSIKSAEFGIVQFLGRTDTPHELLFVVGIEATVVKDTYMIDVLWTLMIDEP